MKNPLFQGVGFQEKRTNRRQRNQPTLITTKDYLLWEKTGLAPGGAYGVSESHSGTILRIRPDLVS